MLRMSQVWGKGRREVFDAKLKNRFMSQLANQIAVITGAGQEEMGGPLH